MQIVERTTSIKEAVRGFAENLASEMPCVRHGRGWRSWRRRGEVPGRGKGGARGEARDVEKRGVGINAEGGKRESDDET